jgi:peptidoglycan/LPS O-acetylase OafA/YrhL
MKLSQVNNFDAIRLFAAIQVVLVHAVTHLHISSSDLGLFFMELIHFFPGVPIFFTISGFLIMWSYERNKENLRVFYSNRLLRIFPALWVCWIVTVALLIGFGTITINQLFARNILVWIFGQVSFMQFYTPDVLRTFGVGTPNGSLWTISVELQFYLIVPLLYVLMLAPRKRYQAVFNTIFVLLLSILTYMFAKQLPKDGMVEKLMGVFLLPYLYNFVFGSLLYKYWASIEKIVCGKGLYWLLIYTLYGFIFSFYLGWYSPSYWPNFFGFISNMILAIVTISVAYSGVNWSEKLLYGNDFSYGIYIYHMLMINIMVQLNYIGSYIHLMVACLLTFVCAVFSWFYIERPAMAWKKKRFSR